MTQRDHALALARQAQQIVQAFAGAVQNAVARPNDPMVLDQLSLFAKQAAVSLELVADRAADAAGALLEAADDKRA